MIRRRELLIGAAASVANGSVARAEGICNRMGDFGCGFGHLGGALGGAGNGGGDAPQTTAFLARANAVTTLDATHTNAYKALINGGVADGWFQKLDLLFIFATQSSGVALLNLPSATYSAAGVSSPTFTVDRGFTGNGTSSYVTTNFIPSTAVGANLTQNSGSVSGWNLTAAVSTAPLVSAGNGTTGLQIYPQFATNNTYLRVNDAASFLTNSVITGHFLGNRDSSTTRQGYLNGSVLGTYGTVNSAPLNATAVTVLFDNVASSFATNQVAEMSVGGNLTPTDVSNFYSRLRAYMTSVGVP
jgi:hypothetical protein